MPRKPAASIQVDLSKIRILSYNEKLRLLTLSIHDERRPHTDEQKSLKSFLAKGRRSWNKGRKVILGRRVQKVVGFSYCRARDPILLPVVFHGWKSSVK